MSTPLEQRRSVVALDVDECLFAFLDFYALWRTEQGLPSFRVADMDGYGVHRLLGQTRDEARVDEMRFLRERASELPAMPGATEAVAVLAECAELHVVTARVEEMARPATEAWLRDRFGDVFAGIHMKSVATPGRTKGDVCTEIGATVLVDDSPANLATLHRTRGVLLGDWPWTHSMTGDWVHAADWSAAVAHLDLAP